MILINKTQQMVPDTGVILLPPPTNSPELDPVINFT